MQKYSHKHADKEDNINYEHFRSFFEPIENLFRDD